MVIGIIAAMSIEIKKIKEELGNYQKTVIAGVKFYKSQIAENINKFIKKTDIPYEQMGVLLREFFDIYV